MFHKHKWERWQVYEIESLITSTNGNATMMDVYQQRECVTCGFMQVRPLVKAKLTGRTWAD